MVLGLKSKHKKGAAIKLEYIVHVEEIRPWPPSEPLKSVQTVLLQWENGDQNSGSFLSVAGDSNILFNESFVLPLTLYRDKKAPEKFRKNYLEFSLFEPRRDKAKGSLIGTASVNLADYGLTEEIKSIDAPLSFRKSSNNLAQSALTITLEPVEREGSNSSYIDDNESEFASYTDDDASSQSSRTAGSFESPSRNEFATVPKFPERSMTTLKKNSVGPSITSSPSSISFRDMSGKSNNFHDVIGNSRYKSGNSTRKYGEETSFEPISADYYENFRVNSNTSKQENVQVNSLQAGVVSREDQMEQRDNALLMSESRLIGKMSDDISRRQAPMRSDTLNPNRKSPAFPPASGNKARLKHVQSVIHGSVNGNGSLTDLYSGGKPADLDIPNGSKKKGRVAESKEPRVELPVGKNEWKAKAEVLEEELREIAALEIGLYSVVAEHTCSGNKVHTPARRLSRFYTNACRSGSQAKRASAARAAASGLVLVSKACGNDVPRLSFWLSNSIMLRAIVSQTAAELPHSDVGNNKSKSIQEADDWEDVLTFIMALEKVESWLFSRIVESLWWQTFTPHMQHAVPRGSYVTTGQSAKKTGGKKNTFMNYEQGSISMELWKKAFRDACERLCPIRAVGHECGCLTVLVKLVMGQLVNRLDVAMFNAILRESVEEMPTDPVSDPITNPNVLPIPAGKSGFGAGAQLKNAIGNWSRWLSDLFGLEDDSDETSDIFGDGKRPKPFKAFRLLHALSDLMMLPFGMLADVPTRKEVCPAFGPEIIKRVLNNFVPDEFSPQPIPRSIIDALDSEEASDVPGDTLTNFPCTSGPTKYTPPAAALLTCEGEVGKQVLHSSRLSSLNKSYASDDELDELDSPLTSIIPDSYQSSSALSKLSLMPKKKGGRDLIRYHLLREMWKDDE